MVCPGVSFRLARIGKEYHPRKFRATSNCYRDKLLKECFGVRALYQGIALAVPYRPEAMLL
jgi:hypothetical protein